MADDRTRSMWRALLLGLLSLALAACIAPIPAAPAPTPTIDPDIYNQVPDTTVFGPDQCAVVLTAPAPAYTSNTLGGEPTGTIEAGTYAVGMAADYGSSLWYMLNIDAQANFINSTSAASADAACAPAP